jgi:Fe-S-cluster containining protein
MASIRQRIRLARADRQDHSFVFECTHFDRITRRCDSYASRPGMCRDYPRVLLDQAAPALFRRAAIGRGVTAEQERKLRAGLGIEPEEPE